MISEKIIVVDDDSRIIRSIRLAFPEYEIIGFNDGRDALHYLRKLNEINLVLLDVMMPKIDGISVLSEIKKIKSSIAVILMTAYGSKDVILEALRNRAEDFVDKPIQMPDLKEKIRGLLKEKLYFQNPKRNKNAQVDRIKRFIERNSKNVKLDQIANELCLSSKYVSRLFNKINKTNFRDYKLKIKIERAKTLLTETKLNINEIAMEVGYQNSESFMRIFKRKTKMTPTQYRRKIIRRQDGKENTNH